MSGRLGGDGVQGRAPALEQRTGGVVPSARRRGGRVRQALPGRASAGARVDEEAGVGRRWPRGLRTGGRARGGRQGSLAGRACGTARPRRSTAKVAPDRRRARGTSSWRVPTPSGARFVRARRADRRSRRGSERRPASRQPPSTSPRCAGTERPGRGPLPRPGFQGLVPAQRRKGWGAGRPPGVPPGRWAARGSCAAPGPRSFSTRVSSSGMEAVGASWIALRRAISSASRGCAARPTSQTEPCTTSKRRASCAGSASRASVDDHLLLHLGQLGGRLAGGAGDEDVPQLEGELLGEPPEVGAAHEDVLHRVEERLRVAPDQGGGHLLDDGAVDGAERLGHRGVGRARRRTRTSPGRGGRARRASRPRPGGR